MQPTFNSSTSTTKAEPGSFSSLKWDPFWSADGSRIYYIAAYAGVNWALYSVGAAGGQPELVHKSIESAALSRDGKLMAILRFDPTSRAVSVWLSSPPGSELRPYSEAPFTQRHFDTGSCGFPRKAIGSSPCFLASASPQSSGCCRCPREGRIKSCAVSRRIIWVLLHFPFCQTGACCLKWRHGRTGLVTCSWQISKGM